MESEVALLSPESSKAVPQLFHSQAHIIIIDGPAGGRREGAAEDGGGAQQDEEHFSEHRG